MIFQAKFPNVENHLETVYEIQPYPTTVQYQWKLHLSLVEHTNFPIVTNTIF